MSDQKTDLERTNTGTIYHVQDDGSKVIAPSRRPDGTLRKPIRVRAGYTPLEENVYKGPEVKQLADSRRDRGCIPGYTPEPPSPGAVRGPAASQRIPGHVPGATFLDTAPAKPSKPKPAKQKDNSSKRESSAASMTSKTASNAKVVAAPPPAAEPAAPAKPENRLRNLRKKMLEIETLQARVDAEGESAVAPEVLQKISRKEEVETEIAQLEAQLAELKV
mmetsp:Transcript_8834/g.16907  ORF Transcript_8834/g.16907 Transcript_8834/m.16907 type:complete len:220 (-) Transcript_8834:17-676(-)